MKTHRIAVLAFSVLVSSATGALAEKWLKIDPNDPYSKEGSFHMFDIDSAFEDRATGFVASRMIYQPPETVKDNGIVKWIVWAFDCSANKVYYVANPGDVRGIAVQTGWRQKPNDLSAPVMGGVTNLFGKRLCALKGSWPVGSLPD